MQKIFIPQSRLALIKGLISSFNKELQLGGMSQLIVDVSEPIVRDWFVTDRVWSDKKRCWLDKGVKRRVKLHKVTIDHPELRIDGLTAFAYLNGSSVRFDDLLNEPTSCFAIPFTESGVLPKHYANSFDENRGVKCFHCEMSRKRDRAFLFKDSTGNILTYGASCIHKLLGHTNFKTVRWFGFYQHKFEQLISEVQKESRLVNVELPNFNNFTCSIGLYLSTLHSVIGEDRGFFSSKSAFPTHKKVQSVIRSGGSLPELKTIGHFINWLRAQDSSNQFIKRAKKVLEASIFEGVTEKYSSIISAIYVSFIKSESYSFVSSIPSGKTVSLFKVVSVEYRNDCYQIYLEDAFSRIYVCASDLNLIVGRVYLLEGDVTLKLLSLVYDSYRFQDIKEAEL